MKATGIVRRIDDLGRVVVPKEIRKTLRIREGDPLEIFTDREGKIILKKYSPVGELGANAAILAESIARTLGCTVCITDLDQVVAASGAGSRELKGQYISEELDPLAEQFISEVKRCRSKLSESPEDNPIFRGETFDATHSVTNGLIDNILTLPQAISEAYRLGQEYLDNEELKQRALSYV